MYILLRLNEGANISKAALPSGPKGAGCAGLA